MTAGDTLTDPDVAPPVEKPVPVHDVALLELQVSVEELPDVIEVGLADSEAETILTVALAVAGVPPLVHDTE